MFDENYTELFSWFDDNLEALVAVGIGGNSALAKRLRVKAQWRDRYGRWVKMGIGVKVKVRLPDGRVVSVIGKFVGASSRKGWGWIRVVDDPNVPNGYLEVESANAQEILASLDEDYLKDVGVEAGKDVDGNVVGVRDNAVIPNLSDINRIDLETSTMEPPTVPGWKVMSPGRLAAHKSKLVEDARKDFFEAREAARLENPSPSADEVDISEYVTNFSAEVDEFYDSRFIYESESGGLSTIIVSPTSIQDFPGKLEATAEMLTNLERDYPVPGGVAVHITPFVQEMKDEAQKFGMISGGTAYSGGFRPEMEDNPYAIRIQTSNFERRFPDDYTKEDRAIDRLTNLVPAHFYQKGDTARSVVAHEWGHVLDFATPREDYPEFGGGMSEKVEKLAAEDPSVLDALGTYGRSKPVETVAETFAQMALDRYDGLGRAQIDARLFDIVEQPVERAQLRGVRANKDWSRVAEASPEFAQKYDQRGSHLAGPALDDARVDKHIAFLRSTGYDLDSTYEANFPAETSGRGKKKKTAAQLQKEITKLNVDLVGLDDADPDYEANASGIQDKIDELQAELDVLEGSKAEDKKKPVAKVPATPEKSTKNVLLTEETAAELTAKNQEQFGKLTDPNYLQSEYGLSENEAKQRASKIAQSLAAKPNSDTEASVRGRIHKSVEPLVKELASRQEGIKAKGLYADIHEGEPPTQYEPFDRKYGKVPDVPVVEEPVVDEDEDEDEGVDLDSLDPLEAQEIQKRLGQGSEGLQGVLFGVKGKAATKKGPAIPSIPVSRERIAERLGMDPKDISDADLKQLKQLQNSASFKAYRDRIARANFSTTNANYQSLSPQELSDLFSDMETDVLALDNENLGGQLQGQLLDIAAQYSLPSPTPEDKRKPAALKAGDTVSSLDDFKNLPAGSSIIAKAPDGTLYRQTRSKKKDPDRLVSMTEIKRVDSEEWRELYQRPSSNDELANQVTFADTTVERVGPETPFTPAPEGYEDVGPLRISGIKAGDIINGKTVSAIKRQNTSGRGDGVTSFDVTYEDGTTKVISDYDEIEYVFRPTSTDAATVEGPKIGDAITSGEQLDKLPVGSVINAKQGRSNPYRLVKQESGNFQSYYKRRNGNWERTSLATRDEVVELLKADNMKMSYESEKLEEQVPAVSDVAEAATPGTSITSLDEMNALPDGTKLSATETSGNQYTLTKQDGVWYERPEGGVALEDQDLQGFLDAGDTFVVAGERDTTPASTTTTDTAVFVDTEPLSAVVKIVSDFWDGDESKAPLLSAAKNLSDSLQEAQNKIDAGEALDAETAQKLNDQYEELKAFLDVEMLTLSENPEEDQASITFIANDVEREWDNFQKSLTPTRDTSAPSTPASTPPSTPEIGSTLDSVDQINSLPNGSVITIRAEGTQDLILIKEDGKWFAPTSDEPDVAYSDEELQTFVDSPDDVITFESGPSEVVDDTPATDEVVAPEVSTKDPQEMTLEEIYAETAAYSDYRKALPRGQRTPEQQAIIDQMSRRETELRPQTSFLEMQAGQEATAKAVREALADLKVGSVLPSRALADKAVEVEGFKIKDPKTGEIFTSNGLGDWSGDNGTYYSGIITPLYLQGGSYEVVEIPTKSETVSTPPTESLVKAIGLEKITVRTKDSDYDDEPYLPTDQQRNVIDAIVSDIPRIKVPALAGTGKTTTLVRAARMKQKYSPDQFGVYIAFNKSVQTEAEGRFPNNVAARTGDSLSFNGLKEMKPELHAKFDKQKTQKPITRQDEIADAIGVPFGQRNRGAHARRILAAISQFSISDDDEILEEHFIRAGIKEPSAEDFAAANKAWADINNPNGRLKFNFDHIMKIWALSDPDLSRSIPGIGRKADFIFMDEAQDMNPVLSGVIERQDVQVIYVGDSYQAIYGFRGGKDELDRVEADVVIPLTKTFRFGEKLAGPGNRMLSLLEAKYKIEAAGKTEGKILPAGTMKDATAVLVRTNAGRFLEMINELDRGRVVGMIEKDYKDAETLVATVKWLQTGQGNKPFPFHEDLTGYNTWKEVETDILKENADAKVEMIGRLFEKFGTEELEALLKKVVVIKNDSGKPAPDQKIDVLVMTAHKSKGLEFDKVRIGNDFRGPKLQEDGSFIYPDPEELRLGYVALTRAENELDPGSLSWIYQHSEEKDEDPAVPSRGPVENPNGKAPDDTAETVDTVDDTTDTVDDTVDDTADTVDDTADDDTVDDDTDTPISSSAELEALTEGSFVRFVHDDAVTPDQIYRKIDGRWVEVDNDSEKPLSENDPGVDSDGLLDKIGGEFFVDYEEPAEGTDSDGDTSDDPQRAMDWEALVKDYDAGIDELNFYISAFDKRTIEGYDQDGKEIINLDERVVAENPQGEQIEMSVGEAKQGGKDATQNLDNIIMRRAQLGELNENEQATLRDTVAGIRRELNSVGEAYVRLSAPKNKAIEATYIDRSNGRKTATHAELEALLESTQFDLIIRDAFYSGTSIDETSDKVNAEVKKILGVPSEPTGDESGGPSDSGGGREPGGGGGSGGGGGGGGKKPSRDRDGDGQPDEEEEEEIPWYERPEYQPDPTLPRLTRDDWNSDLYKTPEVVRAQELQARYNRTRQRYQALIRQAENSKNMSDRDKMSLAWQIKVAEGESIIAEKKLKKYIENMSQADLAAYNRTRQPDEANAASLAVDEMARTTSLVQSKYDQYVRVQDELFAASRAAPGRGLSAERTMSLTAEKLRLEGELAQYTNYMLELESRLDDNDRNNWERWAFQESIRLRQEEPETYRQRLETMQGMLPCVPEEECGDLASLYKGRRTDREDFEGPGRSRVPGQEEGEGGVIEKLDNPLAERSINEYENMPLEQLLEARSSATAEYRDATAEIGDINNQIRSVNDSIESAESVSDETVAALEALHKRRSDNQSRVENAQRIVAAIANASKNRADGGNLNQEAVDALESEHRAVVDARDLNTSRPGTIVAGYLDNDPTPRRFVKHLDGNWYQEDLYQNPILSKPYSANSLLAAMDTEIAPRFANNQRSGVPIAAIEGRDAGKFGPMWQHDNVFDTLDTNSRIIVADYDGLDPARLSASLYDVNHEAFIKAADGKWYKINKGGKRAANALSETKKKQILDALRKREKYGEISSPVQIPPYTGDPMEFDFPSDASPGRRRGRGAAPATPAADAAPAARRRGRGAAPAATPAPSAKTPAKNSLDKFTKVALRGERLTQPVSQMKERVKEEFGYEPSDEQLEILKSVDLQRDTIVRAVAGAGKTTTLRMIALANPEKNITYIVFNKNNQVEAQAKFPSNVQVLTSSALFLGITKRNRPGFVEKFKSPGGVGRDRRPKFLQDATIKGSAALAEKFEVPGVSLPPKKVGGKNVNFAPKDVAAVLLDRVISAFAASVDEKVTSKHFDGSVLAKVLKDHPELVDIAQKMWDDISTPVKILTRAQMDEDGNPIFDAEGQPVMESYVNGQFILIDINHMTKMLQLDKNFSITDDEEFAKLDLFMMDEAQDMNPADTEIFFRMNRERRKELGWGDRPGRVPMVVVGDPAQSIYGFRGSIAGMSGMAPYMDEVLPLTSTYRFPPMLAFMPNAYLALLGYPVKVNGAGGKKDADGKYSTEDYKVYIDPQEGLDYEDFPEEMRPYIEFTTPSLVDFLEGIPRDPQTGFLTEKTYAIARENSTLLTEGIEPLVNAESDFRIGAPPQAIEKILANIKAIEQLFRSPEKRNELLMGVFAKFKEDTYGEILRAASNDALGSGEAAAFLKWAQDAELIPPYSKLKDNPTPEERDQFEKAVALARLKAAETRQKWYIRARQIRPIIPEEQVLAEKFYVDALKVKLPEENMPEKRGSSGSDGNLRGFLYGRTVKYEIWQSTADSQKNEEVTMRIHGTPPVIAAFQDRLTRIQAKLQADGKISPRSKIRAHKNGGFTISKSSAKDFRLLFKELDKPARRYEPVGAKKVVVPAYDDLAENKVATGVLLRQPRYKFEVFTTTTTGKDGTEYVNNRYKANYKDGKVDTDINYEIRQSGLDGYVELLIDDWQLASRSDSQFGDTGIGASSTTLSHDMYLSLGFVAEYDLERGRAQYSFVGTQEEAQKILDTMRLGSVVGDPMTDRLDADVFFMTGHGAKGAEADNVYIMAGGYKDPTKEVDKNGLPRYDTTAKIMEEAHNQFMAITRPKKKIVMGSLSYIAKIATKEEMGPDPKNRRAPKDVYFAKKTARGEAIPVQEDGIIARQVDPVDATPAAPRRVGAPRRAATAQQQGATPNVGNTTTTPVTTAPVRSFPAIEIPEGLKKYDFNGDLKPPGDARDFTPASTLAVMNRNTISRLREMLKREAQVALPTEDPRAIYEAIILASQLNKMSKPDAEKNARRVLAEVYDEIAGNNNNVQALDAAPTTPTAPSTPATPATPTVPALRTRTRTQRAADDAANQVVALESLPDAGGELSLSGISPESLDQINSAIVVINGGRFSFFDAINRTGVSKRINPGFSTVDPNTGDTLEVPDSYLITLSSGSELSVPKDVYDNFTPPAGGSAPAAPRVPNLPIRRVRQRAPQTTPATPATPPATPDEVEVSTPRPAAPPVASKIDEFGLSLEAAQELTESIRILGDDMSKKDAFNRFGIGKQEADGRYFITLDSGDSIEVSQSLYNNFYANPDEMPMFPGDSSGRRRGRGATTGESQISPDTMAEIFDRYALMAEYRKAIAQGRMSVPLEYSTGGVSNRYNASMAEVLEALKLTGFTDEEINEQ